MCLGQLFKALFKLPSYSICSGTIWQTFITERKNALVFIKSKKKKRSCANGKTKIHSCIKHVSILCYTTQYFLPWFSMPEDSRLKFPLLTTQNERGEQGCLWFFFYFLLILSFGYRYYLMSTYGCRLYLQMKNKQMTLNGKMRTLIKANLIYSIRKKSMCSVLACAGLCWCGFDVGLLGPPFRLTKHFY